MESGAGILIPQRFEVTKPWCVWRVPEEGPISGKGHHGSGREHTQRTRGMGGTVDAGHGRVAGTQPRSLAVLKAFPAVIPTRVSCVLGAER